MGWRCGAARIAPNSGPQVHHDTHHTLRSPPARRALGRIRAACASGGRPGARRKVSGCTIEVAVESGRRLLLRPGPPRARDDLNGSFRVVTPPLSRRDAASGRRRAAARSSSVGRPASGNPYPFTNPPLYVISHGYDMDITTTGIFFGKTSYPCYIYVISVVQKRYIWIYLVYPKIT